MSKIVIVYHSGYGHTKKVAEAVASTSGAALLAIDAEGNLPEGGWEQLAAASMIVFGAPTYMGGASAPFKVFADASAKAWFSQRWKDKVAGGFTCSLNMSGDKFSTLMYFATFAMQHGMIWVGTGTQGAATPGDPQSVNRLGGFLGVMAQADNVPPEQSPPAGDIESARGYGRRIAEKARALRR